MNTLSLGIFLALAHLMLIIGLYFSPFNWVALLLSLLAGGFAVGFAIYGAYASKRKIVFFDPHADDLTEIAKPDRKQ